MNDYSSSSDLSALGGALGGLILCYFVFVIVLVAFMIFVYYKIFQKTGNSGWLALLMLVPLVNLGLILYLAFSDWPVLRELRDLRARTGYIPPGGGYPGGGYPTGGYPAPAPYGTQPMPQPIAQPQAPVAPQAPSAPQAPADPFAPPSAPQSPQPPYQG